MCLRVQCQKCGKPTWVGCGRHVEDVLRDVPPAQRCDCPPTEVVPGPSARAVTHQRRWSRLPPKDGLPLSHETAGLSAPTSCEKSDSTSQKSAAPIAADRGEATNTGGFG